MSYTNYFRIISLIISVFYCSVITAQSQKIKFGQIGLEQGLSQSTVYAITQDKQGFMWFGTQDGLNRYDGYSVIVFKPNADDPNTVSDNTILSLLCDSKGNLWIGTMHGGVNRYVISENKFYHYNVTKKGTPLVYGNYITSLFEDSKGNVWIGTFDKGLSRYDPVTGKFKHYDNFQNRNSSNPEYYALRSICEDVDGNLWVATSNGLYKLYTSILSNNSPDLPYAKYEKSYPGLSSNDIHQVYCDKQGILWAGTRDAGLNYFDKSNNRFRQNIHNSIKNSLSGNSITSIKEDLKGNFWITTNDGGLTIFDRKKGIFTLTLGGALMCLYVDRSGILWIGTYNEGVKMYDWRKNQFRHFYDDPMDETDLKGKMVTAIMEDREGDLWVGTYGSSLNCFNRNRERIRVFTVKAGKNGGLSDNRITSICETTDGRIWIGTLGGLNVYDKKNNRFTYYLHTPGNKNSIKTDQIYTLFADKKDNLWIGCRDGQIDRYNPGSNTFTHYSIEGKNEDALAGAAVNVIYEDKQGNILAGITLGGGLHRFSPQSASFKFFIPLQSKSLSRAKNEQLSKGTVLSVYEDNNVFWIGSTRGLNMYEPSSGLSRCYTEQDGLANDIIYAILPDRSGNLWLSTNRGLSRFDPKSKMFKNYTALDGLQADEFNQGAYYISKSGEMFFGGMKGFNAFFPDVIGDNDYIPPVCFISFKVFDKPIKLSGSLPGVKRIKLSYSQNFFSFEFVVLNYTAPEKNQYAYKLEGFDDNWHIVTAQQRYGSYTNLDPGEYVLHIKGANNNELWNEKGTSVAIIVSPPFWMTWWFRILSGVILIGLTALLVVKRLTVMERRQKLQEEVSRKLIEKEEQERKRIAGELHDSIGQELIVIKNRAKMGSGNEHEASVQLEQISEVVSSALDTVRRIAYNLRPYELDRIGLTHALKGMIRRVMEVTNINFTVEINNIDKLLTPEQEINVFRILQESLNNIIKHAEATQITIIIEKKILLKNRIHPKNKEEIYIKISDNGKGFIIEQEAGLNKQQKGFGLPGLLERIRILKAVHRLRSAPGEGTELVIQIPL